jgi:hypothetical protein
MLRIENFLFEVTRKRDTSFQERHNQDIASRRLDVL